MNRSADEMVNIIEDDPTILQKAQNDPSVLKDVAVQAKERADPLKEDRFIYRAVVLILGATILSVVLGGLYGAFSMPEAREISDALIAIGSAAVGALAGLLAPSPSRN